MLKKLVSFLRNMVLINNNNNNNQGYDALYMDSSDHKLMNNIAIKEKRVIITRDKRYYQRKFHAPCLLLKDSKETSNDYIVAYKKIKKKQIYSFWRYLNFLN